MFSMNLLLGTCIIIIEFRNNSMNPCTLCLELISLEPERTFEQLSKASFTYNSFCHQISLLHLYYKFTYLFSFDFYNFLEERVTEERVTYGNAFYLKPDLQTDCFVFTDCYKKDK